MSEPEAILDGAGPGPAFAHKPPRWCLSLGLNTAMDARTLTPLERAVLKEICAQYPQDRASLEAQLAAATVSGRQNTGAGFFTDLHVPRDHMHKVAAGERASGSVIARLDGLAGEMGFVVFLEDGFLNCLEGYVYGDESTLGIDLMNVRFQIIDAGSHGGKRD